MISYVLISLVAPFGRVFKSPLGVKTNISPEYKLSLKSSIKSIAFDSCDSRQFYKELIIGSR